MRKMQPALMVLAMAAACGTAPVPAPKPQSGGEATQGVRNTEQAGAAYPPTAVTALAGLLPPMPEPVTSFGAASDGKHLYVLGGYSGTPHAYAREGQSQTLWRVAVDGSSAWERFDELAGGVQGVSLVHHAGKICRIGGNRILNAAGSPAQMQSLDEAACFDPQQRAWQALPALPAGRSSHEAAVVGSRVFVAGGWQLSGSSSSGVWQEDLLVLDLRQPGAGWSRMTAPFRRRALGVAAASGKLIIVGGLTPEGEPSSRVDVYDPQTGSWSRGPDYPQNAFGIAATGMEGAVVASAQDGTVYRWQVGDAAWQPVTRLAFGRFFHQLVPVGPSGLLAVGGISGMHGDGRTAHVEKVTLEAGQPVLVAWSMAYPGTAKNRQGVFVHGDFAYLFGGNNSLGQHDFAPDNFVSEGFRLHLPSMLLRSAADFPARRQTMQTISGDAHGIALGGFGHDGHEALSFADGYAFDFETERWSEAGSLPRSRTQFGLAAHDGALWVFGGLNYDPTRPQEQAFEHVTEVLKAPARAETLRFVDAGVTLPGPRRAFAGAVLGDAYYLVGGMKDNFQLVEDCLRYDFTARVFASLPCPAAPRLSGALVPSAGRLYLAGGSVRQGDAMETAPDVVELDPETGTWRQLLEALPFDTRHMHVLPWKDRVLMISTHNDQGRLTVAVLDPRGGLSERGGRALAEAKGAPKTKSPAP